MNEKGYNRDWQQCREKPKTIKGEYIERLKTTAMALVGVAKHGDGEGMLSMPVCYHGPRTSIPSFLICLFLVAPSPALVFSALLLLCNANDKICTDKFNLDQLHDVFWLCHT